MTGILWRALVDAFLDTGVSPLYKGLVVLTSPYFRGEFSSKMPDCGNAVRNEINITVGLGGYQKMGEMRTFSQEACQIFCRHGQSINACTTPEHDIGLLLIKKWSLFLEAV